MPSIDDEGATSTALEEGLGTSLDGNAYDDGRLDDSEPEDMDEEGHTRPGAVPRNNATANKSSPSARMTQFEAHFESILDDMFWKDCDSGIPGLCATKGCPSPATTRCRECRAKEPLCEGCAVLAHRNLPFHWIDVWNGTFFQRRDLRDLGFVCYLGHHGDACPHIPTGRPPAAFVIVHDNGIHQCRLHYCHCPGARENLSQLLRADLFPATLERTETAFTCEVLERFHVDFDISKRSTQDFVRVLTSLSARDRDTGEVKDRYRDFLLASRIYRYLTMRKRSGRRHAVVVPGRQEDDLTVPCLTCPIPSFNLPEDWKDTPERLRYIYRLILCADGNYSLQKKTKPDDAADVALSDGQGFFIPHSKMYDELTKKYNANKGTGKRKGPGKGKSKGKGKESVNDDEDEDLGIMCSGFKVIRSQRTAKFKFVDVSGVLSFSCDHLHFRPGATVDLQTTETWLHADFGLGGALRGTAELHEIALSYDVICSYICHILERFKTSQPTLLQVVEQLKMLLPKMHMHAHKELCQVVYAFCYARGFGLAHGEGVETPWAELNAAGLSTREMNAGARHDALNSVFNFWNWQKTVNMGKFLARKLREAYALQRRTTRYFASLTVIARPEVVTEWLKIDLDDDAPTPLTFREKTKNWAKSVYLLDHIAVPSADGVMEEILASTTHLNETMSRMRNAAARFVKAGVELEQELLRLQHVHSQRATMQDPLDDSLDDDGDAAWATYRKKLANWRARQRKHMPGLEELLPHIFEEENLGEAEEWSDEVRNGDGKQDFKALGLPSDFSAEERSDHELADLAEYELKIRIGLAFDQLDAVRMAVQHRAAQIENKKKNVRTSKANAVAERHIRLAAQRARALASRYNANHSRICALRPMDYVAWDDDTAGARLQTIDLDNDLTISNMATPRTLGDSRITGSWIWSVFQAKSTARTAGGNGGDSAVEMVQWFRARAAKDRADEAVNKICAEFRRTSIGYAAYADLWRQAAQASGRPIGEQAYALKTAAMWERMRIQCDEQYDGSRRPGVDASQLDQTRSLRPYIMQLSDGDVTPFEAIMAALHAA
ncbi:hypothetical protein OH77DRAFT_1460988 [Trametes cingulata]|nr:hypothetical protein OH77DRAFT_1460988 [Trametes cingulata]